MKYIDEDGIERCCPRWHKDFCDCVQKANKTRRKRIASKNKMPFGPHKGIAYYSLKTDYLKSLLADGLTNKDVEAKIIEVLESRKCTFTVGSRDPDAATEKQCAYIKVLERKLGVTTAEKTDTSKLTKKEACLLIDSLKSKRAINW